MDRGILTPYGGRMPSRKALLVAPLVVWWSIRTLLGRRPNRGALTVSLSLLTLLYFLIVVGTGVFWVATQELPVFDWHYLPGYILLALTALHVVLHWRNVVTFLRSRAPRSVVERDGRSFKAWVRGAGYAMAACAAGLLLFGLGVRKGTRHVTVIADRGPEAVPVQLRPGQIAPRMVKTPAGTEALSRMYHEGSSYPARVGLPGLTVKERPPLYERESGRVVPLPGIKPDGGLAVLDAYDAWRTGQIGRAHV